MNPERRCEGSEIQVGNPGFQRHDEVLDGGLRVALQTTEEREGRGLPLCCPFGTVNADQFGGDLMNEDTALTAVPTHPQACVASSIPAKIPSVANREIPELLAFVELVITVVSNQTRPPWP